MSRQQWICFLALLSLPGLALAQLTFEPYASGGYEYNSNIAAVAPGDPGNVLLGNPQRDDRLRRGIVGATAKYLWSRQTFSATAEGRRSSYEHFSRLDHDEYLLNADLLWQATSLFDGRLDYRREQRMAALNARLSSELAVERETQAAGELNLRISPDWRLESGLHDRDLDSPQLGLPDYGLRETGGDLALKYQGLASLSFGIAGHRLNGQYRGVALAPSYRQSGVEGTLTYKKSEQSVLDSALGYTRRENPASLGGTVSGTTGMLNYTRKLTGKTSMIVGVARAVNSYVINGATEFDSTATLKIDWAATGKIDVNLGYGYTDSTFTGQTVPLSTVERADKYQASTLNIDYAALRWLQVRTYAGYQARTSNIDVYQYNGAVVGVEVKLQR
ncbi:MAG TPA: outer membrane beta-barrel protein [Steroidobacteraceae bacterium]|nr:outer membrane beta-barrel protein [Steroidobacteraceae bacterium]